MSLRKAVDFIDAAGVKQTYLVDCGCVLCSALQAAHQSMHQSMKNHFKKFYVAYLSMPFLFISGLLIENEARKEPVSWHLQQAALAPDLTVMHDELGIAIENAKKNGWTHGYTSIFWNTEDENIGPWYQRLVALRSRISAGVVPVYDGNITEEPSEMKEVPIQLDLVNQATVMSQLRWQLLDHNENVRMPSLLGTWYPIQWLFIPFVLSILMMAISIIIALAQM